MEPVIPPEDIDISPDKLEVKPINEVIVKDQDVSAPLPGTKTVWVALTSGGAVTTKLTFLNGVLIKVT